jgi:DEAD/DEAH box helicase domain-containing protein
MDPSDGPVRTAIQLLKAALHRELRTIVYSQSRKLTELLALWAGKEAGTFAERISAYRAGFLPQERREIEEKLSNGKLLAVISTSALELGIDIGDLDLCILLGYPGTTVATWQRGGRVGRSGQDAALIVLAGEDALDQYFVRHPQDLLDRKPEAAVVNPYNTEILAQHLTCAAAELTLEQNEVFLMDAHVQACIVDLERRGRLLRSADGKQIYAAVRMPHKDVDLRGTGRRFVILDSITGKRKGEIDAFRAFRETHPGAVYFHKGASFLVKALQWNACVVKVVPAKVGFYTKVRSRKDTKIIEVWEENAVGRTSVCFGKLSVTDQVVGFESWHMRRRRRLEITSLELPPQIFETEGLWIQIPQEIQEMAEACGYHVMGGIHAIEHAAIGVFPLLVMADRNDLGGIAAPFHRQTGGAAVFIYDAVSGGAGLTREAFGRTDELLSYTRKTIRSCPCQSGCPSCVHSPKCGSGNRPVDKRAALFLLDELLKPGCVAGRNLCRRAAAKRATPPPVERLTKKRRFAVFDLETQRSAQEVGGWHRANQMRVSCAVLYDGCQDQFFQYLEDQVDLLIEQLQKFDLVIGFNVRRFDYRVLSAYTDVDFSRISTLDILDEVHQRLGYRLSLDHLAQVTLGTKKTADGLQALQWWKEGKILEIIDYCTHDVQITRDLFLAGKKQGYLLFRNKAGKRVRIPVDW